jgi:hypothetical protein
MADPYHPSPWAGREVEAGEGSLTLPALPISSKKLVASASKVDVTQVRDSCEMVRSQVGLVADVANHSDALLQVHPCFLSVSV